ncbi:hypothetical protein [Halosimplex sp. J119]
MTVPFPELSPGRIRAGNVSVAPDGTAYVVPSGMHERLRDAVVTDTGERSGDPKVDLALAGWASLQSDGMTDRVNVDAPDGFANETIVRRFARSHDAGSVAVAYHPSGEVSRWTEPAAVTLPDSSN